jgi:hypothetical protein
MLKNFGPVYRQLFRSRPALNTLAGLPVSHQVLISTMSDKFDLPSRYHGSEKSVWYVQFLCSVTLYILNINKPELQHR